MECLSRYDISRRRAALIAVMAGLGFGLLNTQMAVDFRPRPALLGWLLLALPTVVVLHEGVHGLVAVILGERPRFGLAPPLVFVTFDRPIPRNRFLAIALAPLLLLDALWITAYALRWQPLFCWLCLLINTLGATGDVWISWQLSRHGAGTLIQDTRTGVEVWQP